MIARHKDVPLFMRATRNVMESQPQLDPVKSAILQILAREPKFEASQYLLWQALPGFGVQASADDVVEALAWLESQGLKEYCTGLVVLEKPSINRLAACLVDGPAQSSINKALTRSPWSGDAVNERRLERIKPYHRGKGLTIGIIDSTFSHHPRGEKKIYGVYRYWDYVNGCYT
jgi:hypothetical protein